MSALALSEEKKRWLLAYAIHVRAMIIFRHREEKLRKRRRKKKFGKRFERCQKLIIDFCFVCSRIVDDTTRETFHHRCAVSVVNMQRLSSSTNWP